LSAPEMDDAIRALAHDVAIATIENCAELCRGLHGRDLASALMLRRQETAAFIAELVMETADETADSAVHALRSLGDPRG
jgi:hypothetical protein